MVPLIVGIAGGSGSGKTTVAEEIAHRLKGESVCLVSHDSYYHDHSELSIDERAKINYDHPDAFDTKLLIAHVEELRAGRAVEVPIYNYATHSRMRDTRRIEPAQVVIVEGILVLVEPALVALMDIKIFVDADPDIRFIRRLERDVRDRGRAIQSIVDQYRATVRPMHREYCEPSKRMADIIIPRGGHNTVAIDIIVAKLRAILHPGTTP